MIDHTVTLPSACRWRGVAERDHYQLYHPEAGWHAYTPPTREQIHTRMRKRLKPATEEIR